MNIFGDVEPPRWLQEIARPPERGSMGRAVGTGLAGLFLASQNAKAQNERVDAEAAAGQPTEARSSWLSQIPRGLFEAQMNMRDPMWKVKMAQTGALIKQRGATAQLAMERAEQLAHESELAQQEMPLVTEWFKDPEQPIPQVQSKMAQNELLRLYHEYQTSKALKAKTALDDAKIDAANDRAGLRADTQLKTTEMRIKSAEKVAGMHQDTALGVADINAQSRLDAAKARSAPNRRVDVAQKGIDTLTARIEALRAMIDAEGEAGPNYSTHLIQLAGLVRQRSVYQQQLNKLAPTPAAPTAPATNNPSRFTVTPVP